MTSPLDWRILEALDDEEWVDGFYARLAGWPILGGCWEWTGARDKRGFGRVRLPIRIGGIAHPQRVTWLHRHGHVHPGLVLHPTRKGCIGRPCSNPDCWSEENVGLRPKLLPTGRRIHVDPEKWGLRYDPYRSETR